MNRNHSLPILGANGQGDKAAELWHEGLLRLSRRNAQQDKRSSLLTHHDSSEFEESSALPEYADEIDPLPKIVRQHRKDSKTFVGMVWLFAFCVVAALLKWKFGL
jgi:lysine/ornithine N-monooxygenase